MDNAANGLELVASDCPGTGRWSLLAYKEAPNMKAVFETEASKTKSGILPRWVDIHPGVGGGLVCVLRQFGRPV
jgi:hypothetical protein